MTAHAASDAFLILRDICLPIVGLIAAGWLLDRRFRLDLNTLVKLNINLFVPAFIFVQVTESELPGWAGVKIAGFTAAMIALMFTLSWCVAAVRGDAPPARKALQLSTMFYNSGNWGIPLMALAFPDVGSVIQVFVLMTMNIATFSLGSFLAHSQLGGPWRRSLLPALKHPPVHAILIAWALKGASVPVSEAGFLWTPLVYLSNGLIGLALVTLGVQLSHTSPPPIQGRLASGLAIRLLAGPALAAPLTVLFGLSGETANALILGAGAPAAVNTALLAHEFKADARFAAAAVYYSTLLAIATTTCILIAMRLVAA